MGTTELRVSVQYIWAKPNQKHALDYLGATILIPGARIIHHGDYL
jgi:hypothetical protein